VRANPRLTSARSDLRSNARVRVNVSLSSAPALDQGDVETHCHAAAEQNGVVSYDGQRQTWATIRSGLGKGLLDSKDLEP
jgi:hypothetical protein